MMRLNPSFLSVCTRPFVKSGRQPNSSCPSWAGRRLIGSTASAGFWKLAWVVVLAATLVHSDSSTAMAQGGAANRAQANGSQTSGAQANGAQTSGAQANGG